ncbi:MAG: EamA family transporter [Candidatus Onthovivens sp.]
MILTIMFSLIFLKEKISKKNILGLILLTAGVLLISIFSL